MKKLLFLFLFSVIFSMAYSQQVPLYSQYMLNEFLLNPGVTGSNDSYIPLRLTARRQWTGIKGAPFTQAVSVHDAIKRKTMGIGGYIFNDQFGPISQTGLQLSYAYQMKIKRGVKLGMGVAFKAFQMKLDETNLIYIDEDDPMLTPGAVASTMIPDADFGLYLHSKKYFVGLSIMQLIQYKIQFGDIDVNSDGSTIRHYYFNAGYKYAINKDLLVEPSILFKATAAAPMQADLNAKLYYQHDYWLGLSYRTSKMAVVMFGVRKGQYLFGYSFDYTFSNLRPYAGGSHEIVLGYNFKKKGPTTAKLL